MFSLLHRNPLSSLDVELAPLRIPLKEIYTATQDFSDENLIKRGENADVYRGVLPLRSKVGMDVVIRRYRISQLPLILTFYEEIKRINSCLKHKNIVSLVGYCDEKGEKMIVMEHVVNGRMEKYLSNQLTWAQRLHICFGASLAFNTINPHAAVKSFKIYLDEDWEAKVVFCFDLLVEYSYTKHSNEYCFGMMLLEMLYGRKTTVKDVNHYLAKMVTNVHYEEGQLDDIIDPNLRKQMRPETLSTFSEIACKCLKKHKYHWQRPGMLHIVERLKKAFEMQWRHENHVLVENFAYLKIPLEQIKSATNNFEYSYRIKPHIYDDLYKTELNHCDRDNIELPKKKVIIRRIFNRYEKTAKELYAEIEMLTSCKHPNLLTLAGFCDEDYETILVFECDFQETLNDYLRRSTGTTWEQRISICLDIAHGLKYLYNMKDKPSTTHHVIQSANVFLDDKSTIKIGNFRISEFNSYTTSLWPSRPENFRTWLWDTMDVPWIPSYPRLIVDDVYCLGVILFQILTGQVENFNGFSSMATAQGYAADPRMMKLEAKDSIYLFSKIIYQCLHTSTDRPTLEVIINLLEKALQFQAQEKLKIPLQVLRLATDNFDKNYLIGSGGYGAVYKAELNQLEIRSKRNFSKMCCTVAIKRIFTTKDSQGKEGFLAELDVLSRCEHPNIVSLLGCCVEDSEMLLVYEHASNGSLDDYLGSTDKIINLTWTQRLKMCIDIAQGLNYLHTNMEDKRRIIHRDIKSANILLDENWKAKIADFGLSRFFPANHQASTINTHIIAGTYVYLDPEYDRTGSLKRASDIYSFGVVLFEIFSGKLAYDPSYMKKKKKGLAPIAKRHFEMGTLISEMLDQETMDDEAYELGLTIKIRPDHDSLNAFSRIAYQCLAKSQAERPTIEVIIKELNKALYFQENRMKTLRISLEDITVDAEYFGDDNCIVRGRFGRLYNRKVQYNNRHNEVTVKRFSRAGKEMNRFLKEFEVLFKYRHENIMGLVGCCTEMDEKIIVYDQAAWGSLGSYLNNTFFTWNKRLKVCIDIANGLKFLHGGDMGQYVLIHRNLTSSNILLTEDWKAKICGFELSITYPANQEIKYVMSDDLGSLGYCDPLYSETKILTKESDIYSFGVILFEILCGRFSCQEGFKDETDFLGVLAKHQCQVDRLDEIVFEEIKEQIVLNSFATFQRIALQCLHDERKERPTASDVLVQLQRHWNFKRLMKHDWANCTKHSRS